ncbi:MAG TPA: HAMP domain-containing sensor histidine kinase [Vicinamibacterales bacterium]|nr:HAMP domain-containing sensor histidine kinase [Vicinamibacterales bacterium]
MAAPEPMPAVRWYRSVYFRIGFVFVVFVVAVVLAQNAIFGLMMARTAAPAFPGRPPNNLAAILAADVGSALADDPHLDIDTYLRSQYRSARPLFVMLKGGRVASNGAGELSDAVRVSIEAALDGRTFDAANEPRIEGPPSVTAPIQVDGELRGMVILPPMAPPGSPFVRDLTRILSLPGTIVLVIGTTIAAALIFAPARRKLQSLERATERLGSGDLSARAPEVGGDEIARVAHAFNRMAAELTIRSEALRTSDRLRRQMLADVSHELKTPLTAMRGYLETLRMAGVELDIAARDRYLATIERETLRLDRIVQDLLDLARLENDFGALEVRLFSLRRLFEHVVQRHEREAQVRHVDVGLAVPDDADQIVADPERLEQVIENLTANALRHTPSGGSIQLSARVRDAAAVIQVEDSGEGIAPEHLPFVFERFYKVDAARASTSARSGLGLSIAKAIVDRHRGTIEVASAPGRTVFTVSLPQSLDQVAQSLSTNL